MPIKYYLQPNSIMPDPDSHSARILPNAVLNLDDIIKMMIRRGTTVTETDARAVIMLFMQVVAETVADGNHVNTPLVNIKPGILGLFKTALDTFDERRHTKRASLSSGTLLNNLMAHASVEKITHPLATPTILEYLDVSSGTSGSLITPSGIGQIIGDKLKFNPQNPAEGIFFIASNGSEIKVTTLARRTEKRLMFSNPAELIPDTYTLEVRRSFTKDGTIRRGRLEGLRVL
jgi:hypothetical protein